MSGGDRLLVPAGGQVHVAPTCAPSPAPRHLTYRGDATGMVGQVVGPNLLGEKFIAVDADYDAEADRTRVGFAIDTPALRAMRSTR